MMTVSWNDLEGPAEVGNRSKSEIARNVFFFTFLAFCILTFFPSDQALGQDLKWRLEAGDKFQLTQRLQQTTHTTADRRNVKSESETTLEQDWEVNSVDDNGNFMIGLTVTAIRANVANPQFPAQRLEFNSANPDGAAGFAGFKSQVMPLIGLKTGLTMSPTGEILDVQIPEESKAIVENLPEGSAFADFVSAEGIKSRLAASVISLPAKPTSSGDTWETAENLASRLGEFSSQRKFTYSDIEQRGGEQIAVIRLSGSLEPIKLADDSEMTVHSMTEEGEFQINLDQGHFLSSTIKSKMETETQYREITIESVIETTAVTTLRKQSN